MSYEIKPLPGNEVVDSCENPLVAYRYSHAVTRYNMAAGQVLATCEVYASPEDAEPPIDVHSRLEVPGHVYMRVSYPDGAALQAISAIENDLSHIDSPPR